MKSKDLIKLLQIEDPTGETEVCIGNVDIHYLEHLPAYYDGALQVLKRDKTKNCYNVIGGKYYRTGSKISIKPLSISDAILNDDEDGVFEIDYSELSEHSLKRTTEHHQKLRNWWGNVLHSNDRKHFVKWAKEEALKISEDVEDVESLATSFALENIKYDDPSEEIEVGKSYLQMRSEQWQKKYKINVDENGFFKII